jgi:relaxase/mobilization nuclease
MPILKSIGANKKVKNKVYTQTPASLKRVLEYVSRKGKNQDEVYKSYGIGLSDNTDKAFRQIMFNKNAFNKADGRQYKHYVTSYPVGYNDLETIEKITTKFAEENFLKRGFKCYVAIHQDKDHFHSHIIVDSVNFINGYKLQEMDEKQLLKARYKDKELNTWEVKLEDLKTSMEEIALEYGVPSPERSLGKAKTKNIGKMSKYKALEKDKSWRNYIARAWEETILETTTTAENLEEKLKEKGIFFNRFNAENKTLTLATEYITGEEKKVGKIRLSKLETEEDYRFQATPNIYNWDTFMKILEKHNEKEAKEELKIEDLENIFNELEKDAELEKEFTKEIEEIKLELDKGREYKTITSIMLGYKEFYKEITSFLKEVEDHKKDFKNLEEIKKIKENEGWELLLEFNQAHALSKQREKERETERTEKEKQEKIKIEEERLKRIEEEKIRKNIAYNDRHDRLRELEKAREQERIKLNKSIEDNKYTDIKEKEIKPVAEEKEVENTIKRKEKEREYGE